MLKNFFQCANIVYSNLKRKRPFRNKSVLKVGSESLISLFLLWDLRVSCCVLSWKIAFLWMKGVEQIGTDDTLQLSTQCVMNNLIIIHD